MDHRYNYFHQNPNSLVNGQSSVSRSSVDGTQLTNNYTGSISSISSQEQSPFHETKHTIPNAVPLMNNFYQMDTTNQLPRSSGPPRTNAKGMYENPQSSIPNVMNLAQSNAENYPFDPDFQLQPHLTGLLPQQSKKVPEQLYSVDKFSSNRGSIAANMNTNYFSANKPYPEPKIIEYDVEDTSTESSPQHTSSLYSESTDQDSERCASNDFARHNLNKNIDCHVTKESKTIMSSNQELPVPSQFADLSLTRDDEIDDHHSILHSAYNQDDDDVIEDIPLVDNQSEIDYQKNPKSQFSEQNINTSKAHAFNYYNSKNDIGSTEFSNENKQSSSPSIFNNTTNYSPYNINSSNIQNVHQFNKESYFNQSNTLAQSTSSNNSVTQSQNKLSFPYGNTELFSHKQEQSNIQNSNDGLHLEDYNQQNKHIQPVFQNSNVSQIDSKLPFNVNSFTQDQRVPIQSTSPALNDLNSNQSLNSSSSNILCNQQNVQTIASINQQFKINNSSLTSTQSVSPITSAFINTPTLRSSSSVSESIVSKHQNSPYHTSDGQTSSSFNLSVAANNSPLINQDSKDIQVSQSNNGSDNSQLEKSIDLLDPIKVQSTDSQSDSIKSLPSPPINQFMQPNNFFNSQNSTSKQRSDYQQPLINQFTHSQYDDHLKTSDDQFRNNQNLTVQESIPATSHNISHYFGSTNTNNPSIFNQQPLNLQPHPQQQNVSYTQDIKPIVSSLPPSDKPNNFMTSSNAQNTPLNILSADKLQPTLLKKELESNSNISSEESVKLNSTESALIQSDNLNSESLENTETITFNSQVPDNTALNDQFSNMNIDNQENIKIKPELVRPASYFSKDSSLDNENKFNEFQNISSATHSVDSTPNQLSDADYLSQSALNEQINVASSNSNTPSTHQTTPFLSNNQIVPNEKQTVKPITHQFPPQQFNSKRTSDVQSENNQQLSQVFNSEPKSDAFPPSASNQYPTQTFNYQSTSNASTPISPESNQLPSQIFSKQPKSETVLPYQSISNPYQASTTFTSAFNQSSPQIFSNQTQSTMISPSSSESNQFPLKMVGSQPKSDTMSATEVNQQPLKLFDNQSISSAVSNPLPSNLMSSEPKSVSTKVNQQPSKLNDQSVPSTVQPVLSAINPIPSQMFNSSAKSEILPPFQPVASAYSVPSFNNKSVTQNTVSPVLSVTNHIPPHAFGNQPKSPLMTSLQPANSQQVLNQSLSNTIPPASLTASQLPSQMFSHQSKSSTIPLQTTSNQYPSQPYNNLPRSNIVPPGPSVANQLRPQMLSNQIKSDSDHFIQSTASTFPSQPANNQLTSNTVSSAFNQSSQVFTNHSKSDVSSFPPTPSQYQSQPSSNTSRPNMIPSVSSSANLFPSQMLTSQPKLNAGPSNKLVANQYPSQLLSNQPISNIQPATNQYPSPQLSNQSKPNIFPPPLLATNQYPPQQFNNQPGQQMLSKSNLQPSSSNQLYSQPNVASQPAHNQWPPHPNVSQLSQQLNQTNPMFTQPSTINPPNLPSIPPNINQLTQLPGSQMLPPNPLSSNNYYNQVQGIGNIHQPQSILPGQNVQLASKGFPQQSNMGFSTQANYQQQQPNAVYAPQGFQQQDPYKTEHNSSTIQQGFTKTWGYDNLDLLKSRDVLPGDGVQPPEIKLPQGYANCDNCSPDIFRCTMNKFPSSKNLLEKSRLPLGILIHPYKDLSRLTVIQCETITRCRNCRSYINPFVQFIDNAHWKCNLCYRVNELPGEFQIDPYTKTLGDPSRRPEIQNATIEYIASQDYMVRPPQPALYLFLLDVSRSATLTGYLEIVCDRILNKIMTDDIPGDSRTNIGFITYDSSVHFYRIANGDGGQPKQLVISDISDIFLPLPDGLMVNLEENKAAIKDLLTNLPNHFRESYNTGCALGAALQAAFKLLAPRGGRVTVFQSSLPNCGPGSLQPRDDGNPHTGDRVQHMAPSTDFYKKLALECSAEQIAVDMFFISSQYLDIATISGISKYSAGCIHNFSQFDVKSPTMVTRFINCFDRYLSRKIGFEALLRLRCTRGVSIHSFHGNFFVRSYDLLMLPNVNPDNAYGMQLSIEDNLEGVSVVCFQAALLYTSSNAERRIRVHTLCIPVTDNLNDIFHNADQQAISCLIAKMAVDRSTEKSLSDAREAFFNAISDSLSAFKLGCSSYSGPGTMLSPLSLRVFPLYILATLKHTAFRTNQPTRLDERMFSMCQMKSLPLNSLIQYLYPDLYPIHTLEEQPKIDYEKLTEIPLPPVLQLSAERVESNGIYLMDDSETLTIFIGHRCSDQLIQKLFGYVNVISMPELITVLPEVDSKPSYLLRSFISYIQHFKPYPLPIEIIKDNGPHKLRFYSRLVEDKFESSLSYYEFLQRLSQQVR